MHVCEFNLTYTVNMKNWDLTAAQRHIQYSDRKYQIIKGILRIPVEEASLIVRDKSLPCLITVIYEKSLWQLSSGIVKISNKYIFWLQVETYPSQWRIIWLSGLTQSHCGMNIPTQWYLLRHITDPLQLFITQKQYTQKCWVTLQTSCVITDRSESAVVSEFELRVPQGQFSAL